MYLVLGIICCILLCPSYNLPNFRRGFWKGWPTELRPNESGPEIICRPSGLEHIEVVAAIVVP
jgi:hypothetical protein